MPQDIPFEASETLAFTPDCLKSLGADAPVFTLGTATQRDRRYIRRLYVRNGLERHSQDAIRKEILTGLEALWERDVFERNAQMLKDFWQASDDFALMAKEDPDMVFEYDEAIAAACREMPRKVAKFWPPLADMLSDNADFNEVTDPIHVAAVLKGWKNLAVKPVYDEGFGYITTDCAEQIADKLIELERKQGQVEGVAWTELVIACFRRVDLDEEEAKNSESPSPSATPPVPSNTKKRPAARGKSQASANSKKTPQSA